jgi:hypothetical protein
MWEQGVTLMLHQYEQFHPNLINRPNASWFWSSKFDVAQLRIWPRAENTAK